MSFKCVVKQLHEAFVPRERAQIRGLLLITQMSEEGIREAALLIVPPQKR